MGPSRSCWNGTSVLQPVEITSKGTSFMYVLSIKVPIRKMSGNLFNDPRMSQGRINVECLARSVLSGVGVAKIAHVPSVFPVRDTGN